MEKTREEFVKVMVELALEEGCSRNYSDIRDWVNRNINPAIPITGGEVKRTLKEEVK